MNRANVAIFLTAVGLIGVAPVILLIVYALRRRADGRGAARDSRAAVVGVVVATGILLIGGGAVAWSLSARGLEPTASGSMGVSTQGMAGMGGAAAATGLSTAVPDRLAGLPLTSSLTGAEAIRQVATLHGSTFPVRDAVVATYGGGRATIWVSRAPDAEAARTQVSQMVEGIARGGSPFLAPRRMPGFAGVFATAGMGQRHYFFARGETVWWVASDPVLARRALAETLEAAA